MCGIFGIVDKKGIQAGLIEKCRDTMIHRGPDDAGIWISPDRTIGLAHRRLSIIDLSEAGRQPMADDRNKIWVTFNGEIYNFQEIRRELEERGYSFRSNTDTEVILYAYKEWGTNCLQRFNGMFAFGIYDKDNNNVFLARDRVGKKPLYYAQYDGKFVFSSEIKAMLRDPQFPREIDYRALNFYLTFGYIPFDMCIFKCIKKLLPAHAMVYDVKNESLKLWRYWDIPEQDKVGYKEEELLEELEYLLMDATKLRLISDVPLGAFLSGGIDSSLVVAMMSRVSSKPVRTFSIGFRERKYNELPYAKIVAEYFRTKHTELVVEENSFTILPELVKQFDEPFADSSMVPTYYVSKMTRDYVTVALSGDGGDELFGGYSSYYGTLGNYYIAEVIPLSFRKQISRYAEFLPERIKCKTQLLRLQYDPYRAFIDRMRHNYFKEKHRKKILKPEILDILGERYNESEKVLDKILHSSKRGFLNTLGVCDFLTYLPEDILTKVDRMSMKVSLEVRCPILDYRIIEFSFRKVRDSFKIKGQKRKYLLKRLAEKILPKELKLDRKWGFAIPVSEWFRGPILPIVREILLDDKNEFYNIKFIEALINEHLAGVDHSGRLYTLLIFNLWKNEYLR